MEDFEMDQDGFDQMMEHYVEIGAVTVNGIDMSGNFIYVITDKAKELAPDLWEMHHEMIDEALVGLFEQGLIEVEYDEDLNANMKISDAAREVMYQLGYVDMENLDDPDN
jgi:hypothetical protein